MAQLLGSLPLCSLFLLFSLPGNAANVSRVYYYIRLVNALIRDASNRDLMICGRLTE